VGASLLAIAVYQPAHIECAAVIASKLAPTGVPRDQEEIT
jgi:hypothetical protein